MKAPRYTDGYRFPHGYRKACETDVTIVWTEARKQLEEERRKREESLKHVVQLRGTKS